MRRKKRNCWLNGKKRNTRDGGVRHEREQNEALLKKLLQVYQEKDFLLPVAGNIPVLGHIVTELETGADREPDRVPAFLEQIGKQVVMH